MLDLMPLNGLALSHGMIVRDCALCLICYNCNMNLYRQWHICKVGVMEADHTS